MTLKEAIKDYLDYLTRLGRSPATIKTYYKHLDKYRRYLHDLRNYHMYIDELTSKDFEDYLKATCDYKSSAYKYNIITVYKGFSTYCHKKGYSENDTGKQVEKVKRRIKERDYLTPIEIERLFKAIDHETIKPLIKTLYYAGLRIGEGLKLTIEDINFDKNTIIITKGKSKRKRIIPINHKLRNELKTYLKHRKPINSDDPIFVTQRGSLTEGYVNRILKKASLKAGLGKKVTTHIFRHSFASNLIGKGADLYKVKELMGHTSISTTEIYLHTNMTELRKAVGQLG